MTSTFTKEGKSHGRFTTTTESTQNGQLHLEIRADQKPETVTATSVRQFVEL